MQRVLLVILASLPAWAAPQSGQMVGLPYVFQDDMHSTWDIQYDGSINDGGNDLYDGGARLFLNNQTQYQSPTQQAFLDSTKTELIFPPIPFNGLQVSRRVAVLPRLNTLRFVEVFENPTHSPIKVNVRLYFNMGGMPQHFIPIRDNKGNGIICYAVGDFRNGVAMMAAGRGAKVLPRFNVMPNNDSIDIFYDIDVPPRQTVAVAHMQFRRGSAQEAANASKAVKERQLLEGLPREIRKRIINFAGDSLIGDLEVLRGDALDVVELRGGDTYRGSLKLADFRLQTLYGPVHLPAEKVVCLINIGTYRASQLLVTAEGEVFGGRLDIKTVPLQLSGGQVTQIPLSQVTRLGYRKRAGEGEEWTFEGKPHALMRSGERMRVALPAHDFHIATPSGPVRLAPRLIASIIFQGEENNVPEVRLIDGTRLSGLLGTSNFNVTLVGLGTPQSASLPAAALTRFDFHSEQEVERLGPSFTLKNSDTLIGALSGTLSLQTQFDTLHVEGNQVKQIAHTPHGNDHDIQVTLWDDSTISGRLVESHVTAQLKCGLALRMPIALVEQYKQPVPRPSPQTVEQIKQIVRLLNDDNWRTRDHAQSRILSLGPPAISVLRQLQPNLPAEADQRIELMLDRLTEQLEGPKSLPGFGNPGTPFDHFLGGWNQPMLQEQLMLWDR